MAENPNEIALNHDLTGKVTGYLDRHMALMMLEAHSSGTIGIYDHRSLLTAKVGMLKKTKMVDYLERDLIISDEKFLKFFLDAFF